MRNTIFLAAVACLLAGCADNSKPDFKVAVHGGAKQTPPLRVTTEPDSPIRIDIQSDKGLPVENEALQVSYKPGRADLVAIIIAGLAALFVLLSAIGAWRAASNTRRAAEGQLFLVLMKEGSSEEMQDDVTKIEECIPELEEMERNREAAEDRLRRKPSVDDAMTDAYRHVSYYLLNTLSLHRLGYISKDCFKNVCNLVVHTTDVIEILKYLGEGYFCDDRFFRDNEINPEKVKEKVAKLHKDFDDIKNII